MDDRHQMTEAKMLQMRKRVDDALTGRVRHSPLGMGMLGRLLNLATSTGRPDHIIPGMPVYNAQSDALEILFGPEPDRSLQINPWVILHRSQDRIVGLTVTGVTDLLLDSSAPGLGYNDEYDI